MSRLGIPRWMLVLCVAGGSIVVGDVLPERAVVNQYCLGCHGGKVKAAGLALDAISAENMNQHPEAWEKVVRKLRARYMPPAGLPRPDERAYDAPVSSLETSLSAARAGFP